MNRIMFFILCVSLLSCKQAPCYSQSFRNGERDPRVTELERKLWPHLSCCGKCGRPNNCCRMHTVWHSERSGTFALCEECWSESSLKERMFYYANVYRTQVSQGMKDDHFKALMDSVQFQTPSIKQ